MELIEPSPSSVIGWTPNKFCGYIAICHKTVWIKVIQSKHKNRGYLRKFLKNLLLLKYTVKIVDPMTTMEKICIHYNMTPSVERFDGKECIIWTLKEN